MLIIFLVAGHLFLLCTLLSYSRALPLPPQNCVRSWASLSLVPFSSPSAPFPCTLSPMTKIWPVASALLIPAPCLLLQTRFSFLAKSELASAAVSWPISMVKKNIYIFFFPQGTCRYHHHRGANCSGWYQTSSSLRSLLGFAPLGNNKVSQILLVKILPFLFM